MTSRSLNPRPAGLVLEGDAEIGNATLSRKVLADATGGGRRVLPCHRAPAETQLAFAAVADLLGDVLDAAHAAASLAAGRRT